MIEPNRLQVIASLPHFHVSIRGLENMATARKAKDSRQYRLYVSHDVSINLNRLIFKQSSKGLT